MPDCSAALMKGHRNFSNPRALLKDGCLRQHKLLLSSLKIPAKLLAFAFWEMYARQFVVCFLKIFRVILVGSAAYIYPVVIRWNCHQRRCPLPALLDVWTAWCSTAAAASAGSSCGRRRERRGFTHSSCTAGSEPPRYD